jgi:antitoxin Phd
MARNAGTITWGGKPKLRGISATAMNRPACQLSGRDLRRRDGGHIRAEDDWLYAVVSRALLRVVSQRLTWTGTLHSAFSFASLVRLVRRLKLTVTKEQPKGRKRAPNASWQLQAAKARFSELFRRARSEGPQLITRRGQEGVVMISNEQYEQLVGKAHQPKSLLQFFRESPLVGLELNLERDKDEGRDIEL